MDNELWRSVVGLQAQQPVKPEPVAVAHEQAGKPAEVQCDWKEFTSPDGRKYYYNRVTKVSVWQMPEELKRAQAQAAGTKAAKSDPGGVQVNSVEALSRMLARLWAWILLISASQTNAVCT